MGKAFIPTSLIVLILIFSECSDSSTNPKSEPEVFVLDAKQCDPITISVQANQTLKITTTDSVHTNIYGVVEDCDYWTDADGIFDCHYVEHISELHGLPFMALIGNFDEEWFLVGTDFERTFTTEGQFFLSVNDWGECGEGSDNSGKFTISVQKY